MSPFKIALIAVGSILAVTGIVVGLIYGIGSLQKSTAGFRGGVGAQEQIKGNGSFRIAAYNHFFDICTEVQADDNRLRFLADEQRQTTDQTRAEQIRATVTAVRSARSELIAQYNNDARKDFTIGQFKSSNLPYQLDPTNKETSCVA